MKRIVSLQSLAEYARGSLWVLPSLSVALALVAGLLLPRVDSTDRWFSPLLFPAGPEGARGILEAIAASVITVTSLVFSLTVVTLQLASSQFSPRLLRTFLRRPGNQVVLSVFLSTFVYSLVVLRVVRAGEDDEFVPALAVSVAFLLVLASVAALVYFIHHITSEIRADTLMRRVEEDTFTTIEHLHPDPFDAGEPVPQVPSPPAHAIAVPCKAAGIVQAIAAQSLLHVGSECDALVVLCVRVGERVVQDGVLAWAWRPDTSEPPDVERLTRGVNGSVMLGHERTMQQDISYGVRQLVDMANKALSTGVNDPTTAVDAVGHLTSILSVLVRRRVVDIALHDDDGTLRAYAPTLQFEDYLRMVCSPMRRYGGNDPDVCIALLRLLWQVGVASVAPGQVDAIRAELDLVLEAAHDNLPQQADVERVQAVGEKTREALAGQRFMELELRTA